MNDNDYLTYASNNMIRKYGTFVSSDFSTKATIEDRVLDALESEDDLMPLVKKYLVSCLEKIMNDPNGVILEAMFKEELGKRDKEIENLKEEINRLNALVYSLGGSSDYKYYWDGPNGPYFPSPF